MDAALSVIKVHRGGGDCAAAVDALGARATERLLGYLAEAARAPPRAVPLSQSSASQRRS